MKEKIIQTAGRNQLREFAPDFAVSIINLVKELKLKKREHHL